MSTAVLLSTCDCFQTVQDRLLWPAWHHFFSKHWDWATGWPLYVYTETLDPGMARIKTLNTGIPPYERSAGWTWMLREALQQIEEEYVLLLLDDLFMSCTVDAAILHALVETQREYDVPAIAVADMGRYVVVPPVRRAGPYELWPLSPGSPYQLSLQPTIWNKEFLLSQLVMGETPWEFELKGTRRLIRRRAEKAFRWVCLVEWCAGTIRKGRWTGHGKRVLKEIP